MPAPNRIAHAPPQRANNNNLWQYQQQLDAGAAGDVSTQIPTFSAGAAAGPIAGA